MTREDVLQAGVTALRAELARRDVRPLPDLQTYGYDPEAVAAAIVRRGIHPSEFEYVADMIKSLWEQVERVAD